MEWIQATPRPCHHHRFPIRLVRRPPPSGTPPSLEQTSQPQTTLMNWRCHECCADRFPLTSTLPEVRDELAVIADVCFKLTEAVGDLLRSVRMGLNETQLH